MHNVVCVRVGYGTVAQLHEKKLSEYGVATAAVIDTDPAKRKQALEKGHLAFSSCQEAAYLKPLFWDICVNTSQHFKVIKDILEVDPTANFLVEKPVCLYSEIPELVDRLKNFTGKIVINENYASTEITTLVKKIAFEQLQIRPTKIVVEFTKNRQLDTVGGRFIDYELGVLGYEGPHMLAIVAQLGEEFLSNHVTHSMILEPATPLHCQGEECLRNQGTALIHSISKSGVEVELYTSMAGIIRYRYPLFSIDNIPLEDTVSRYRLIGIHGVDPLGDLVAVIGFFEPISHFHRSKGAVMTIRNHAIVEVIAPIEDDCMGTHLKRATLYFQGQGENPYSLEMALKNTKLLHQLAERANVNRTHVIAPLNLEPSPISPLEAKSLLTYAALPTESPPLR